MLPFFSDGTKTTIHSCSLAKRIYRYIVMIDDNIIYVLSFKFSNILMGWLL
jgi:hypothetical protein